MWVKCPQRREQRSAPRAPFDYIHSASGMVLCLGKSESEVKVKSFSCVRLFVTPWTVAYQAPLSMGFSRNVNPAVFFKVYPTARKASLSSVFSLEGGLLK